MQVLDHKAVAVVASATWSGVGATVVGATLGAVVTVFAIPKNTESFAEFCIFTLGAIIGGAAAGIGTEYAIDKFV